ncbi:Uncharacterized protein SCF082_LOCUS44208, partial [Durusdinium trenchii]
DFFHTTVPYFFDYYGDLNPNVGLAQCPKYFPHVQDRDRTRPSTGAGEVAKQTSDARPDPTGSGTKDNNDAQFFR